MAAGDITLVRFGEARQILLTSEQMRTTEQRAINTGATSGLAMMEIAAQGVIDALFMNEPNLSSGKHTALVVCGPGNNGGDGFAIARLLKDLGWTVDLGLYGHVDKLPPDAATNAQLWLETNEIQRLADISEQQIAHADVVIDAVFGTGLTRPVSEEVLTFLETTANSAATIVAVDVPTGINSDTGQACFEISAHSLTDNDLGSRPNNPWPRVNHTVTFQRLKPVHLLASNMERGDDEAPTLSIVDLGISAFEPTSENDKTTHFGGAPAQLNKQNLAHKYEHGHALVFAGSTGKGGAGRLAARAALRIGAGAATLACPTSAIAENAAQLNAIMLTPVDSCTDLEQLFTDKRKNALCLGPGMGVSDQTRQLVLAALDSKRAIVLDADALTCFAADASELFAQTHRLTVLTPHMGEFQRLFPDLVAKAAKAAKPFSSHSQIDIVREAAKRANCHILLKGAVTIVAAPTGDVELAVALGDRAAPWLATAGSGDVLAGFITGLMARRFEPFDAACAAAWLHVECARAFGPGLIAEDLPDMLPRVLSQWERDMKKGDSAP